jgi:hypothetical protein
MLKYRPRSLCAELRPISFRLVALVEFELTGTCQINAPGILVACDSLFSVASRLLTRQWRFTLMQRSDVCR